MTTTDLFLILLVFLLTNVAWGFFCYVIVKSFKNEPIFNKVSKVPKVDRFVDLDEMMPAEIEGLFSEELRKINMQDGSVKPDAASAQE